MYERFESLLVRTGETPYKIAKSTGISQSTLSEWKTKQRTPTIDTLRKLANHFGVPVSYFTDTDNEDINLREKYDLPEGMSIEDIVEAMHKNPQLGVLFSRSAKMDDKAVEAVLKIIEVMNREGEDGI